jgi:prepilin-type N-terminal cleavage/methylation domain-containing protein
MFMRTESDPCISQPPCFQHRSKNARTGFSLLELIIVLSIGLILAVISIPNLNTYFHNNKLRSAGTDYAGLLVQVRFRAVQDSRYYSLYFLAGNSHRAFADIYPQNASGASGSGGLTIDPKDPDIGISNEVNVQPQTSAPNTANLITQFLPASTTITPVDGSLALSPVTFSPFGLPCVSTVVTGGSICNSKSGPVAYWVFLENNVTQSWEAVTVTPAGRIDKWNYTSGAWQVL